MSCRFLQGSVDGLAVLTSFLAAGNALSLGILVMYLVLLKAYHSGRIFWPCTCGTAMFPTQSQEGGLRADRGVCMCAFSGAPVRGVMWLLDHVCQKF